MPDVHTKINSTKLAEFNLIQLGIGTNETFLFPTAVGRKRKWRKVHNPPSVSRNNGAIKQSKLCPMNGKR